MNTACTCVMYLMLIVTGNGEQQRPIEFNSKVSCDSAKPIVRQQYPSGERYAIKMTCIKK